MNYAFFPRFEPFCGTSASASSLLCVCVCCNPLSYRWCRSRLFLFAFLNYGAFFGGRVSYRRNLGQFVGYLFLGTYVEEIYGSVVFCK